MEEYQILWRKTTQGAAEILRIYGKTPAVSVPEVLQGYRVEKLASYCFSDARHIPKDEHIMTHVISNGDGSRQKQIDETGNFTEIAGDLLLEAVLPDTLTELGASAFYNCKKLKRIQFGAALRHIGSDAFMNTRSLHEMTLCCGAGEKTGLKQILAQISSDIEVIFQGRNGIEAVLLYPEYYESYDEIAPAHIFGRSITGEGFRARQSFREGRVEFLAYDRIFPKALVEESEKTLSKMAINRLMYPFLLAGQEEEMYRDYVASHVEALSKRAVEKRDLNVLRFLWENELLTSENLKEIISYAAKKEWAEGVASFMDYRTAGQENKRKSRYEFEDF